MNLEKAQRELIRWYVLVCINSGRPYAVAEPLILSAIQTIPIECTAMQLRRELDYLEDRRLLYFENCAWSPTRVQIKQIGDAFKKAAERTYG